MKTLDNSKNGSTLVHDYESVSLRNIHQSECGMMAWGTIFGLIVLMVLFTFVANTINTVNQKIETQSAADAVAYSSSVWLARGMNSVTATNHIIGELNAIYVIHHSLGGKRLDEKGNSKNSTARWSFNPDGYKLDKYVLHPTAGNCTQWNKEVTVAYNAARAASLGIKLLQPIKFHYNAMGKKDKDPASDVNSTIFRGMRNLKFAYIQALIIHAIGAGIYHFPDPWGVSKVVGGIIVAAMVLLEFKIWQEYITMTALEVYAKTISTPKKMIPLVIDTSYVFLHANTHVVTPFLAYKVKDEIARNHGARGFVRGDFPDDIPKSLLGLASQILKIYPGLPIEQEATTNKEKNQLMRATYPWVVHWRKRPHFFFSAFCSLSWAWKEFPHWTNEWTMQSCERFRHPKKKGVYNKDLLKVNGKGNAIADTRLPVRPNALYKDGVRLFVMADLNDVGLEEGTPVTLYQHIDYGGYRVPLEMGRHNLSGGQNNDCSSLRITGGYRVTVYDGNFSGASRTYLSDVTFVGGNFNDMMSSVLVERNPDTGVEKGTERWTKSGLDGTLRAEKLFCMMGFAHRPKTWIASPAFFRQENPYGFAAYSQGMLYNGNPQLGGGGAGGETQPVVGWDTLNWDFSGGSTPVEYKVGYTKIEGSPPYIKPNWQAKLVPLSGPKMIKTLTTVAVEDGDMKSIFFGGPVNEGDKTMSSTSFRKAFKKAGAQLMLQNH